MNFIYSGEDQCWLYPILNQIMGHEYFAGLVSYLRTNGRSVQSPQFVAVIFQGWSGECNRNRHTHSKERVISQAR